MNGLKHFEAIPFTFSAVKVSKDNIVDIVEFMNSTMETTDTTYQADDNYIVAYDSFGLFLVARIGAWIQINGDKWGIIDEDELYESYREV